jgi:hypothetical protein
MVKCGVLFEVRTEFLNINCALKFINISICLTDTPCRRMSGVVVRLHAFVTSSLHGGERSAVRMCATLARSCDVTARLRCFRFDL